MRSIRATLGAWLLAGLAVVSLVTAAGVSIAARGFLLSQLDETLAARARALASLVGVENGALRLELASPIDEKDVGGLLRVVGADGEVIATSDQWPIHLPIVAATSSAAKAGPEFFDVAIDEGATRRGVRYVTRIPEEQEPDDPDDDDDLAGAGRLFAVELIGRTDDLQRSMAAVTGALAVGAGLALIGVLAAVRIGVRRGLKPLTSLRAEIDSVRPGRAEGVADPGAYPEELRPIAAALNDAVQRLESAAQREARFTDAAAHELRSPIAELRALADVAERWPEPERLTKSIGEVRAIAAEMQGLVEALLSAARGAPASAGAESTPLLALARAEASRQEALLHTRRLALDIGGDDLAAWTGPRGAVHSIVRNLLSNAAEYTREGGSIRVHASSDAHGTRLEVENGPVDLDPAHISLMTEPFWRAEASRSDRGHRGLGLAVVQSLCEGMDLNLHLSLDVDSRVRATVSSNGRVAHARSG